MHALDRRELRDALRLKPIEEFPRRARIGAARVRVPDLRGEKFEEAIGRAQAGCGNKGRGAVNAQGYELVHEFSSPSVGKMDARSPSMSMS